MTASPCAGYSSARVQTDTHRAESRCRDVFFNPQLTSHSTLNRATSRRLDSLERGSCWERGAGPAGGRLGAPPAPSRPAAGAARLRALTAARAAGVLAALPTPTHCCADFPRRAPPPSSPAPTAPARRPRPPRGLHAASRAARSVPPSRGHAPRSRQRPASAAQRACGARRTRGRKSVFPLFCKPRLNHPRGLGAGPGGARTSPDSQLPASEQARPEPAAPRSPPGPANARTRRLDLHLSRDPPERGWVSAGFARSGPLGQELFLRCAPEAEVWRPSCQSRCGALWS